jgi:hypothetical protein
MDKLYFKIAYWLPPKLIYFCYIRFMAHATTWKEGSTMTPDEIGFSKAIEFWEDKYGKF